MPALLSCFLDDLSLRRTGYACFDYRPGHFSSLYSDDTSRASRVTGRVEPGARHSLSGTPAAELAAVSYHQLVTGFLQQRCSRTGNQTFCGEASRFNSYLKTAPVLSLLTTAGYAGSSTSVAFKLSKVSNVTITVLQGSQTVYSSTGQFAYGTDSFALPALAAGSYTLQLSATDLAGNPGTTTGTLTVS